MVPFDAQKPEDDVDLLKWFTTEARKRGGDPEKIEEHVQNDRRLRHAVGRHSQVQRHQINQYLHFVMLKDPKKTVDMRYQLLDVGEIEQWQSVIGKEVMNWYVENICPKAETTTE